MNNDLLINRVMSDNINKAIVDRLIWIAKIVDSNKIHMMGAFTTKAEWDKLLETLNELRQQSIL